ncbi:MAG: type I 3-dehydroquinate dehydratase [Planctomycetes bacterium]|nr:type I 3-dehydroquinate dehydratase [Planctomycetota bacterium]
MTLLAASIPVRGTDEPDAALRRATQAVEAGARLIEWRIDALAEEPDALAAIKALVRRCPAPCIVTCRVCGEGGDYGGTEDHRAEIFEALVRADHPPRYIDIELAAYQRDTRLRRAISAALKDGERARDAHTSLILSVHDFDRRPADLLQRIEAMTNEPACSVIKVAWQARSLRDNLEALDLLAQRAKPMIALCMGRFGLMSRVLAPKFGGLLTFTTDRSAEMTAPGQPTIDELQNVYRFQRIGPPTKVYGVIGWPVEHSLGPSIHNAGFEAVEHASAYLPMAIPPQYEHFKATVGAMLDHQHLGFRGASVTSPHKEHLLRFVADRGGRIDALVERIGAANTLVVSDEGFIECFNTDAPAAREALCAGMGIERSALAGVRIAVLGAGGVARAVVAGLVEYGATVVVFNRSPERAEALVASHKAATGGRGKVAVGKPDAIAGDRFDVFINCTPIGMAGGPAADESPLPDDVPLDENVTVFDTVYMPQRTPLIQQAQAHGARAISGLDMYLRQAAMQFERWTGCQAPTEAFAAALKNQ